MVWLWRKLATQADTPAPPWIERTGVAFWASASHAQFSAVTWLSGVVPGWRSSVNDYRNFMIAPISGWMTPLSKIRVTALIGANNDPVLILLRSGVSWVYPDETINTDVGGGITESVRTYDVLGLSAISLLYQNIVNGTWDGALVTKIETQAAG